MPGQSLPSRGRGLKLKEYGFEYGDDDVAPLAGAWIEIPQFPEVPYQVSVAPLAGAWIEIKSGGEKVKASLCRSPRGGVD